MAKQPRSNEKPRKLKKAFTPDNIRKTKRHVYHLTGEWKAAFGALERGSRILVYGPQKNGKTHFTLKLLRYLMNFEKAAFNACELGNSLAMEMALDNSGIDHGLMILDRETIEDMENRFTRQKAAGLVAVDSIQYLRNDEGGGLTYSRYIKLSKQLNDKTMLMVSHAQGNEPAGIGKRIQYDVDVLVYVKGFVAYVQSRYGGGEPIVVWADGARDYNGFKTLSE